MAKEYRYVVHTYPNERFGVYDTSIGRTVCNGAYISDSTEIADALNLKEEISYILQQSKPQLKKTAVRENVV